LCELDPTVAGVLLGVHDSGAGGHQVQLPRPDGLLGAQTVTVQQFPGEHPRHCLQTKVRVRANPSNPGWRFERPAVVEEAPGAHGAPGPLRQCTSHRDGTDVGYTAVQ
jgi:hypothetical protein